MELNYEKDIILVMKLLAYSIESFKYWNPNLGENPEESYGQPWVDIELTKQELEDIGIPISRARLLQSGVCAKQGMKPSDFIDQSYDDDNNEIVTSPYCVTFPTLFWIGSIIERIENNQKQINPELIKLDLGNNNSLSLNGITGEFT